MMREVAQDAKQTGCGFGNDKISSCISNTQKYSSTLELCKLIGKLQTSQPKREMTDMPLPSKMLTDAPPQIIPGSGI